MKDIAIKEESMHRHYLIVMCTLSLNTKEIPTNALIDCGATVYAFIDQEFANLHELPLCPLKICHALQVIDGQKISSYDIRHIVEAHLSIHEYCPRLPLFVTKSGLYPMLLGIPWLKRHDVAICLTLNLVTFGSQSWLAHCNDRVITV
jgi:hypothetical protein